MLRLESIGSSLSLLDLDIHLHLLRVYLEVKGLGGILAKV